MQMLLPFLLSSPKGDSNGEKQILCGDDNKKDKCNCVPSPSL
jgi:hypothetical protein